MIFTVMLAKLLATMRVLRSAFGLPARKVQAYLERLKAAEDAKEGRGITLLREWLSKEQQAQFDASKFFEVTGCDSGKRYRIRYGTEANVHELDEAGQPVMGWCFIPTGNLVPGDVMLSQKLSLETNETSALRIANKFPPRAYQRNNGNVRRA